MGQRQSEINEIKTETGELNRQIEALRERGEVTYPLPVKLALSAICEQDPKANPQVLCDLVEVRDEA